MLLRLVCSWFLIAWVQPASDNRLTELDKSVSFKSQSPRIPCGIAASYLFAFLGGRDVDSSFLEKEASTEPQLMSLEEVKDICQQLGLSVKAFQVELGSSVEFRRPVIAHIETPFGGHYLVLRPTRNGLQLIDPQLPEAPLKPDHSNVIPVLSSPLTGYFIAEDGAIVTPRSWHVADWLLIIALVIMGLLLGTLLGSVANWFAGRVRREANLFSRARHTLCCLCLSWLLAIAGCGGNASTTTSVRLQGTQPTVSEGLECLECPDEVVVGSEPVQFNIRLRNRSNEPIAFEQVERSGACCSPFTLVSMTPDKVEPGGEFTVTYECLPNQGKGTISFSVGFRAVGSSRDRIFQRNLTMQMTGARIQVKLPQVDFGEFCKKDLPLTRIGNISFELSEAFDPNLIKWDLEVGGVEVVPLFDKRREQDYVVGVKMHTVPVEFRLASIAQDDEDFLFPVYLTYGSTKVRSNVSGTVLPEWSLGIRATLRLLATPDRCLPDEMTLYHHGKSVSEIATVQVPNDAPIQVSMSDRSRVRFTPNPEFWKAIETTRPANAVKVPITVQGTDGGESFSVEIPSEVLAQ